MVYRTILFPIGPGKSMAGHSQFKNIMHRKGAQDAKRGKVFTKIIRELTISAKMGLPDPDMGEQVTAVVAPADWSKAGPELEAELIDFCKSRLATLKCPKSVHFEPELPRDAVGKLAKKVLRERYREAVGQERG